MNELIARLEAATEGDRMLDGDIREAIGEWKNIGGHWLEHKSTGERKRGSILDGLPNYTTSLDAALTLVNEKWFLGCERFSDGWYARVAERSLRAPTFQSCQRTTAALALATAALRALSHTAPQEK